MLGIHVKEFCVFAAGAVLYSSFRVKINACFYLQTLREGELDVDVKRADFS